MSNAPHPLIARQRNRLKKPAWLRFLLFLQHCSSFVTVSLVVSTLIVYAGVVYSQQQWSSNYDELKKLQRSYRNLIATNETLKNQLAEQAEQPEAGLVLPDPDNTIVLPSPSKLPSSYQNHNGESSPTAKTQSKSPNRAKPKASLGY